MRKKYLSALLFGALLFASAGTFTSCKDYDDDINGLREDVTSLQSAVTTLQNAVENGKYVSAVSNNGNTITFTYTDGTTTEITLEDEVGSVVTVNADGVLCIDGEPTDIKAAADPTPGEEHKDQIIIENNMWSVLQEDGTYKSTGIPVSGVTVSGSEADGYTFTIYASDGTPQTVKLPSAVSSITEMTLGTKTIQSKETYNYSDDYLTDGTEGSAVSVQPRGVLISHQDFNFNPSDDVKTDGITSASKWLGNKKLPNNGDFIYASPTQIDLRMDPVDVPAENINFYLTNTLNKDVEPVVFTASPSQTDGSAMTGSEINGRAATTGNGLWALSMANQVVAKDDNEDVWDAIKKSEGNTKEAAVVYALNANHGFRSKYQLTVQRINPEELTGFYIEGIPTEEGQENKTFNFKVEEAYVEYNGQDSPLKSDYLLGDQTGSDQNISFKTNVEYTVNAVQASALYDMYLTADDSDREVYGLSFNQDKHTFTIGKNPDVSSIPAEFDLIIYSVANNGEVKKTVVTIVLNSEITTPAEYGLHEHDVNIEDYNNNYFGIDLATMKTALGDNLNQWMQNVDINKDAITFQWSTKADKDFKAMPDGITAMVVEKLSKKDSKDHAAVTDRNKANYIQVDIDNSKINSDDAGLELDKTYYIKATFKATKENGGNVLNSIVVPVEFHAPALSELFSKKDAYLDKTNDVINAYFYQTNKGNNETAPTAVTLARYFNDFVSNAQVTFTNDKVGETGETGETLFELQWTNGTNTVKSSAEDAIVYFGKDNSVEDSDEEVYTTLDFDADKAGINDKNQGANGYNEVVTIKATKGYFNTDEAAIAGWNYAENSDKEYTFKIRLMSPIYEGTVTPVSGSTINISANDWSKGARITDAMIKGEDYNGNDYNVVPDKVVTESGSYVIAWDNEQIDKVTPGRDKENLIKRIELAPATYDSEAKKQYNGAFVVYGENITNTTEVQMPVTVKDVWGYELQEEVSVTIQANK